MKKTAFLKIRTTPECLAQLKVRAGKLGKAVSAYAHDELERANKDAQQAIELAALKSQVQELVVLVQTMSQTSPMPDAETQMMLRELRLLVRELAMSSNAQIVARVAAQLKTSTNHI